MYRLNKDHVIVLTLPIAVWSRRMLRKLLLLDNLALYKYVEEAALSTLSRARFLFETSLFYSTREQDLYPLFFFFF